MIKISQTIKKTVRFKWYNGKRYMHVDYTKDPKKAEKLKKKYESGGSLVEIEKSQRYYEIYTRGGKYPPKYVVVYTSDAHRRKKHDRKPTQVKTSKALRIGRHKRRWRSTLDQIEKRGGTLKEVRKKKKGKK